AQVGGGGIEQLQRLFLRQVGRNGNIHEGLRPIAAEVGEGADFAVGKGHQGAARIADDRPAQGKMFDAALRFGDLNGIANDKLVLEDDVKAGDDVPDEILGAKANGQGGEACEGGHGKDVNADFLRGCQ